jgi:NAD(P)-dependent dehydrogenase (short-subunit alcohol dehydrogenase family)
MSLDATSTTDDVLEGVDLSGRTAVITGASGGLGLETARALAAHGAAVVLAARDDAKTAAARDTILGQVPGAQVDTVHLDLSSLASVRAAAADVAARFPRIDLLIDNAGVMACPLGRTADGFEMQFGTNHLGHFLFTTLLEEPLVAAAPSRVVVLSSAGHRQGGIRWDDPNYERADEYFNWDAYGQAKTANALFALELDRRWSPRGVHAFSVHPGVIMTDLARHMTAEDFDWMASNRPGGQFSFKSVEQGAATTVWAATAPELDAHGGTYLEDCSVGLPTEDPASASGVRPWARDAEAAQRLWALSEELVAD